VKKTQKRNPKEDPAMLKKKNTGDYRLVGDLSISDYFWQISGIFTA